MIPYSTQTLLKSDIRGVNNVLKSHWLTQGPIVNKFENNLRKIVKSKRVIYDCPYRTVTQFKKIKNLIKINKAPIDIINTRYMGHFLWQIAKGKNI